ncbi:MAG: chlororespiratory reduction protein 7 [Cyanobacteria bacterium J06642_9]
MPDALMYQEDMFVLLALGQAEEFLTPDELKDRLKNILATRQDDLPRDLQKFDTIDEQAQHLAETACELELAPGQTLQWYAVRLEK